MECVRADHGAERLNREFSFSRPELVGDPKIEHFLGEP
jgi:hypothetical protein